MAAKKSKETKPAYQSEYSIDELAQAAQVFGTNGIIVRAALGLAGKQRYTKQEAEQIIKVFRNEEVK